MNIKSYEIKKEELLNRFGANRNDHIQVVSVGESFEFYVVTQEELRLIIELFDLKNPKEIEEVISKLYMVGMIWDSEDYNLKDLIDSWNTTSNENAVTMIQLLDSFFKASIVPKAHNLSVSDVNNLTSSIATKTRESGSIIGNTLKSIISRISSESVIKELNAMSLDVTDNETAVSVFNKIKNYLNEISDADKRDIEMVKLAKLIGGNYHAVRTSTIIETN